MARKGTYSLRKRERTGGVLLLVLYLLLPFLLPPALRLLSRLLAEELSCGTAETAVLYALAAVTVLLFLPLLASDVSLFFADLGRSLKTVGTGLLLFYGANGLARRLVGAFGLAFADGSDRLLLAIRTDGALSPLLSVLLLPLTEALLLRVLPFRLLGSNNRAAAFVLSALLGALSVTASSLGAALTPESLLLLVSYLLPGLVLGRCYMQSGSAVTVFLLHAALNALFLFV